MPGGRTSFRRDILVREPFSEMLRRYASGEDSDMSYRASRHGPLIFRRDARVHHIGAPGGRLSARTVAALGALNPAALHVVHSIDRERSLRETRRLLRRRFLIHFIKDLTLRQWTIPTARGLLFAMRNLDAVFAQSPDEIGAWYASFQERLIEELA